MAQPLIVGLRETLEKLRVTIDQFERAVLKLREDAQNLKDVVDEHFELNAKLIPHRVMADLEKELKQ